MKRILNIILIILVSITIPIMVTVTFTKGTASYGYIYLFLDASLSTSKVISLILLLITAVVFKIGKKERTEIYINFLIALTILLFITHFIIRIIPHVIGS